MALKEHDLIQFREQTSFLGYEFLVWTFLLLEKPESSDEVASMISAMMKTSCRLVVGSRLSTCLMNHKEQKTVICCPIMEDSHEVYASLKNGHVIESLALVLYHNDDSIKFLLHAHDGGITHVTISNN